MPFLDPICSGRRSWSLRPDDAAAIAIGHFVKDKVGAFGHGLLARDLEVLEDAALVTPWSVARVLREHGLRRAGLVGFAALQDSWDRADGWLDANQPTRGERAWAKLVARRLRASSAQRRVLGFVLARTIGDDSAAIAANLLLGTMVRAPFIALESASRLRPSVRFR